MPSLLTNITRIARVAFVAVAALSVSGCSDAFWIGNSLPATQTYATQPVSINAGSALSIVNNYRARNGLGGVSIDGALMRAARNHAHAMARVDRMKHSLGPGDGLRQRIRAVGYRSMVGAENIGVRYKSFAEAMDAWIASSGHRRNLLNPQVTEIGVAAARAPDSQNGTFWVIVLARPRG